MTTWQFFLDNWHHTLELAGQHAWVVSVAVLIAIFTDVGMYVEGGKFLHVSEKEGVILSDLDNVYWNKHYWMARRVE